MAQPDSLETVDDILSEATLDEKDVVLRNGKTAHLRSLTAAEMVVWLESAEPEEKLLLMIQSLVDSEGRRIGDPARDIPRFKAADARDVSSLVKAALLVNGLSTMGPETRKNVSGGAGISASPSA
jgi:hypothetical protein